MADRKVRVRFAPSPTGALHIGGVRTALYNYLFARQHGGELVFRIEDTDSHRFVPGAEEYILESFKWLGIKFDEGVSFGGEHGPYRQSERRDIYKKYVQQLLDNGKAYIAFDTPEELEAKRAEIQNFQYDAHTRMQMRNSLTLSQEEVDQLIADGKQYTVRFKIEPGEEIHVNDMIRGDVKVMSDILDDKVLYKSADELPTYHLANIVDDHLMEISHVIRGEEWLPSAPLHVLLYKAFGWEDTMPRFAHLSLLLKPDGKGKLSKRDGDRLGFPVFPLKWVNAAGEESRGYREDGYFPEAFVNMLAMLGWNPGDDRELFTMDELIGAFSLDRVIKSGARFNPDKARWYNKEYLRTKSDEEVTGMFIPMLESHGFNVVDCPACALTAGAEFAGKGIDFKNHIVTREYVAEVVSLVRERATFVKDIWEIAACLFLSPADYAAFGVKAGGPEIQKPVDPRRAADPRVKVFDDSLTAPFLAKDVDKFWKEENFTPAFQAQEHVCASGCAFTKESIEPVLEDYIREQGWPMGKVMNCIRLALTGASSGLGIADILSFIGSREFASRMAFAAERLGK